MEGFSRQQRAETNRTKTKTMATDSNPDQNTLRCHHCAGPLSMKMVSVIVILIIIIIFLFVKFWADPEFDCRRQVSGQWLLS